MDPTRFDHLTRLLAGASGRRALLRALLGAAFGGATQASAKPREPRHGPGQGQGQGATTDRDQARLPPPTSTRTRPGRRRTRARACRPRATVMATHEAARRQGRW